MSYISIPRKSGKSPVTVLAAVVAGVVAADPQKFTTSYGRTYAFEHVPARDSKPTYLLLHGYPSSRYDWRGQIEDLAAAGFGVLAPDCLGYGDSDKPTDVAAYNLKAISSELTQILDHQKIDRVIGVGHDWGSILLSRAAAWHPDRFQKLAFLSIPYSPAGVFLDIDANNALGSKVLGYMPFGYWYFLNSYDAADLIGSHLESFFHLVYHTNASSWAEDLANIGAARSWLNADKKTDLPAWLSQADKDHFVKSFSQPNATAATINYYQALMRGIQAADEKPVTDQQRKINVPVLAIGGSKDLIIKPELMTPFTQPWTTAGFTMKTVDAGHWLMLEQRQNVSTLLADFGSS